MSAFESENGTDRKGGWVWLFLPVLLMLLGSNLVFGVFFASSSSLQAASRRTLEIGPITWSVLHVVLLGVALSQIHRAGGSVRRMFGYDRLLLQRDVLLGVGLGMAAAAVVLIVQHLQQPFFESRALPWPKWVLLYWTVVTSITAGLGEEFYFRGFLFNRLQRLSVPVILVVTSVAFSIWHIAPNMLVHTFFIGLLFGVAYVRTGRLLPVVLGHTLTDMLGGIGMLAGWW